MTLVLDHSTADKIARLVDFALDHGDLTSSEEAFLRGIKGRGGITFDDVLKFNSILLMANARRAP